MVGNWRHLDKESGSPISFTFNHPNWNHFLAFKLDFFSLMMMVATAIKLDANYNPSYLEYKRSFPNSRIFGLAYNGGQMKRNFLDQVKARMSIVKPFQDIVEAMIDDFKLLQWDTNYASGVNYHDPYRGF